MHCLLFFPVSSRCFSYTVHCPTKQKCQKNVDRNTQVSQVSPCKKNLSGLTQPSSEEMQAELRVGRGDSCAFSRPRAWWYHRLISCPTCHALLLPRGKPAFKSVNNSVSRNNHALLKLSVILCCSVHLKWKPSAVCPYLKLNRNQPLHRIVAFKVRLKSILCFIALYMRI